jgi:hypothetical protein
MRTLLELADSHDSSAGRNEVTADKSIATAGIPPREVREIQLQHAGLLAHEARYFRKRGAELTDHFRWEQFMTGRWSDNAAPETMPFPTLSKEARCCVR